MNTGLFASLALAFAACSGHPGADEARDHSNADDDDRSTGDGRAREPFAVDRSTLFIDISLTHGCLLSGGDDLRCWGDNTTGELGVGSQRGEAVRVEGLGRLGDIAVGDGLTCVCDATRTVRCWGFAGYGSSSASELGRRVVDVPPCERVVAGSHYACSLDTEGVVRCWGQTPLGDPRSSVVGRRSSSGFHRVPLRIEGLPTDIVDLAAGGYHACAIDRRRRVHCWGSDQFGQRSSGRRAGAVVVVPVQDVVSIAASSFESCALDGDGRVWCWGAPGDSCSVECGLDPRMADACRDPRPRLVATVPGAIDLVVGDGLGCGRTGEGLLSCWGHPPESGPVVDRVVAIALAGDLGCSVEVSGLVRCWGARDASARVVDLGTIPVRSTPSPR